MSSQYIILVNIVAKSGNTIKTLHPYRKENPVFVHILFISIPLSY